MPELTTRERYQRCLSFAPVDRAPFQETVGPEDLARWEREGYPAGASLQQHFGFDDLRAIAWVETPDPPFPARVVEERAETRLEQLTDGSLVERSKRISFQHLIRPPVATLVDWEEYRRRLLPAPGRVAAGPEDVARMRADQAAGRCAVRSWMSGFFGYPRTLLGLEAHLLAFFDQPELLRAIGAHWVRFQLAMIEETTSRLEIDYFLIGEDIAYKNGPFILPALFRQFLAPHYRQVVDLLKARGVRHVLVDTDGDFGGVISLFQEVGVTGFLPVEVQAGMRVPELRRTHPRVAFIGGVDKRLLYAEDPGLLERHIREEIAPAVAQGGYIPGCDHAVPREASYAQYCRYLGLLQEVL
ncbi:MAG: uroporphyrinogen decarboxylase family protein [Candidatus Latescibacterota bacterium]